MKPTISTLFLLFLGYGVSCYGQAISVASITSSIEIEGETLIHEITLTGTTTTTIALNYSFVTNTTVFGGEFTDFSTIGLPDGQYFDPNGQIIYVPPGHSHFRFRSVTIDDDFEEDDEYYTLQIGGVSATGTILDNDGNTTTVSNIGNAEATEGGVLIHEVELSNPLSRNKTFEFLLIDDTTDGSDYWELAFSDNIVYDEISGLITIPRNNVGLTSFTITMGAFDDLTIEDDESYNIIIDNVSATGTILDNDLITILAVRDASDTEGSDLTHHVTLSNLNPAEKTFTFLLTDITTDKTDYDFPEFSNGVTYDPVRELISVPRGISSFSVTIPTIDDSWVENDESYNLSIDDHMAVGYILNNDTYNLPKFFTPNNDNINDIWPTDLLENNVVYTNAEIYIFDRYGTLIIQVNPNDSGWNGTVNAQVMPEDDYWYRITLENGTILNGHFTLKR